MKLKELLGQVFPNKPYLTAIHDRPLAAFPHCRSERTRPRNRIEGVTDAKLIDLTPLEGDRFMIPRLAPQENCRLPDTAPSWWKP